MRLLGTLLKPLQGKGVFFFTSEKEKKLPYLYIFSGNYELICQKMSQKQLKNGLTGTGFPVTHSNWNRLNSGITSWVRVRQWVLVPMDKATWFCHCFSAAQGNEIHFKQQSSGPGVSCGSLDCCCYLSLFRISIRLYSGRAYCDSMLRKLS